MKNTGISDFLRSLDTKKNSNQHAYLGALRLNGFMLCPFDYAKDYLPKDVEFGNKRQYFVRATRLNKYKPFKDRFDFSLIFGVKYAFSRVKTIRVYVEGELHEIKKLPWPGKARQSNYKKPKRMVEFPAGMSYGERRDWRDEYYKHYMRPGKYPESPFYLKWKEQILWTDQAGYNARLKSLKLDYKQ